MLDLVTSTLSYCSLNFLTGSTFSISKGGVIIVTAFFSKIFLKRIIVRKQWIGCGLTLIGIIIAGVGDSLDSEE
jgi:drug/metabolite transporter (DMT)-like permease